MNVTSAGNMMLQNPESVNQSAPLIAGFVTGTALTLAIFGMLGKLSKD